MSEAKFITVDMLASKLDRHFHHLRSKRLPIGLHAWPKCGKRQFCGIGLIDWSGDSDPQPIGDVFVGAESELYDDVNRKLRRACDQIGLEFISMA